MEIEVDEEDDDDKGRSGSQENSDGMSAVSSTPSETPKASKKNGKRTFEDQNTGTRKAAARLKEKCNSRAKAEDQLLKEATMALKAATSSDKVNEETDQDMLYGKWLGGELKQISDLKAKQLIKIKIQNLLFEAQFGESAIEITRPMPQTSNFGNFGVGQAFQVPNS